MKRSFWLHYSREMQLYAEACQQTEGGFPEKFRLINSKRLKRRLLTERGRRPRPKCWQIGVSERSRSECKWSRRQTWNLGTPSDALLGRTWGVGQKHVFPHWTAARCFRNITLKKIKNLSSAEFNVHDQSKVWTHPLNLSQCQCSFSWINHLFMISISLK